MASRRRGDTAPVAYTQKLSSNDACASSNTGDLQRLNLRKSHSYHLFSKDLAPCLDTLVAGLFTDVVALQDLYLSDTGLQARTC